MQISRNILSWLNDTTISTRPTPMATSKSFLDGFQNAEGDPDEKVQEKLKKQYGIGLGMALMN
jgi:hypothetical protein